MFSDTSPQNDEKVKKSESGGIDLELSMLMGQIHTISRHCLEKELDHGPITAEGLWFLAIVQMLRENATPGNVAKWMARKHNSTCAMLDRLEKKGFVEKKPIRKHGTRPQVGITVTEKGMQIYETRKRVNIVFDIFSCLSTEEKKELRRFLLKIRERAVEKARVYEEPPFPSSDNMYKIP